MARDEEFRKVAEDIGALARSLGRDFREAVDQARRGGHSPGRSVRHGLRGVTDEARRGMRTGWTPPSSRRRGRRWSPSDYQSGYGGWGGPPWAPPPAPGAPAGQPGPPGGPTGPGWGRSRPWPGPPGTDSPVRPAPPRRRRQPLPPLRHRWDATTVVGMLAVLFGVAWLIGATGLHHVSIEAVVAVGLMLLGASLVITGRTDWSLSRRSWPMWLGAGLIVLLVATSTTFGLGGALNNVSFGHMKAGATPTGQLPSGTIHGGFGNLTVDLTHATTSGTVRVVSVAGNTTVDLPPDAQVKVDARVVAGQISVNGQDTGNGLGAHDHETIGGGGPTTLTVDIRQIFGQILIDQGSNR